MIPIADLRCLVARHLEDDDDLALIPIMTAAALTESPVFDGDVLVGADPMAVGDFGPDGVPQSLGLYQINDINGLSPQVRFDPEEATAWMLLHAFRPAYAEGVMRGYTGESLAAFTYMRAERPYGYQSPNQPGTNSPAGMRFREQYRLVAPPEEAPVLTYNPDEPRVAQTDDWSCSVASTAWLLRSLGHDGPYPHGLEEAMLNTGLVSAAKGLLDGSGAALADWLSDAWGVRNHQWSPASWAQVCEAAGNGPVLIGGYRWNHWSGVRAFTDDGYLILANPADGHKGIHQTMTRTEFNNLGPFSMIHVPVAGEDMARIAELETQVAELESLVGVLRAAGGVARENIEKALAVPRIPKLARVPLEYGALPAAQTVERGGE
jgi:hypothetical protein